jgi:hypothetical protein
MNTAFKTLVLAVSLAGTLAAASAASAETRWQADHPRRVEVNARLADQSRRIAVERRDGQMGPGRAMLIRAEDRRILRQERFDARRDHGHITRVEQRRLNHEENFVSRQIGR